MKRIRSLFGLPFLLAGLTVFYFFVFSPLLQAWQMQAWQQVSAQLLSAEVTSYQSRNDNGGYTTMYQLDIRYSYQIAGVTYTGDRASISGYSSSNSEEHYQRLGLVQQQQRSPAGFMIWVDPDNPANAVFDRRPDWIFLAMLGLFSGVFILVGGGLLIYARVSSRARKAVTSKYSSVAGQSGNSPLIFSNAKSSYRLFWFLAVLALMFLGMFALPFFRIEPVIGVIFGIAAVSLSGWLARKAWQQQSAWNYFQKVPVTLEPFPGVIGGRVAGKLTLPGLPQPADRYLATLECIHQWRERSGKESRTERAVVWSQSLSPRLKEVIDGTEVQFDFYVPASCQPTSEPDNDFHRWTLNIQADLPGIAFNRHYEVPVYVTEQSQSVAEELEADPLSMDEAAAMYDRLDVEVMGQAISMQTPGSKSGWFIGGIGAAFFIIGALIKLLGDANFGIAFAAVSLIFVAAGIWFAGRTCDVRITPELCEIDVFLFGRPVKQHRIPALSVVGVEAYRSSSTQVNGRQTDEKFALRMYRDTGQVIDLGGEFPTLRNAEHMRQEILGILGLEVHS